MHCAQNAAGGAWTQPDNTFALPCALSVQVRPDPLIVRTDAVYHVNLWLLTLAATLATRPVLPDISALNATAQDNVPMTLARGMQRVPWSLEPVNELEIERFFYGDEQDAAALCQTEEGRRYWDWLRTRPGRRPDFDPGQRPPGFINLLPDTQRGWDQPSRCRALEWDIQRERARAALWRGVPDGPITPAPARVLMGDLARDQSTDSDSSATDKQQGLQEPEQPQQSEQASGEAHSAAGQEQPLTPTQPTKSAKKAGLCERLVCAAERKACRWKAKAGRAVDFVQAKVGEALDFIMSI